MLSCYQKFLHVHTSGFWISISYHTRNQCSSLPFSIEANTWFGHRAGAQETLSPCSTAKRDVQEKGRGSARLGGTPFLPSPYPVWLGQVSSPLYALVSLCVKGGDRNWWFLISSLPSPALPFLTSMSQQFSHFKTPNAKPHPKSLGRREAAGPSGAYLSLSCSASLSKCRCSFWPSGASIVHTQNWLPLAFAEWLGDRTRPMVALCTAPPQGAGARW